MSPAGISLFTIINICLMLPVVAMAVSIVPKFHKIFKEMDAELPLFSWLAVGMPGVVYVGLLAAGVLVLIGKDLLIRSQLAKKWINIASAVFIVVVLPTLVIIALFPPLVRLMTGVS